MERWVEGGHHYHQGCPHDTQERLELSDQQQPAEAGEHDSFCDAR